MSPAIYTAKGISYNNESLNVTGQNVLKCIPDIMESLNITRLDRHTCKDIEDTDNVTR